MVKLRRRANRIKQSLIDAGRHHDLRSKIDTKYTNLFPLIETIINRNWNRKYEKQYVNIEVRELYELVVQEAEEKYGNCDKKSCMDILANLLAYVTDSPNSSPFHYYLFKKK